MFDKFAAKDAEKERQRKVVPNTIRSAVRTEAEDGVVDMESTSAGSVSDEFLHSSEGAMQQTPNEAVDMQTAEA